MTTVAKCREICQQLKNVFPGYRKLSTNAANTYFFNIKFRSRMDQRDVIEESIGGENDAASEEDRHKTNLPEQNNTLTDIAHTQATHPQGPSPQQPNKPNKNAGRVIKVIVVLAVLGLVASLLGIYLRRKPEMMNVSQGVITKYEHDWKEITRYFFNIYGLTLTGRADSGQASVTIVKARSSLPASADASIPDFMTPNEVDTSNNLYEYQSRDYGFIDIFTKNKVFTLRGLNPINRIYYFNFEEIIRAGLTQAQSTSSRLLTHSSNRILTQTASEIFAEVLAEKIAELEGVELDRIIVKIEEVWTGTLDQGTNQYSIQTIKTENSTTPETVANQTAEQKKKAAEALYDSVLAAAIEEKKLILQDDGALIADRFSFGFDRYIDLFVTFEKTTYSYSDEAEEEESNTTIHIKPPIVIEKSTEAVYGFRPEKLKECKTIEERTYDEIISCVDYNQTTKVCTVEEWNNQASPFTISAESRAKQDSFETQIRYRVSVRPLPADQVHQESYFTIDPLDYYKGGDVQSEPADAIADITAAKQVDNTDSSVKSDP